jgi:hypothetical protein
VTPQVATPPSTRAYSCSLVKRVVEAKRELEERALRTDDAQTRVAAACKRERKSDDISAAVAGWRRDRRRI